MSASNVSWSLEQNEIFNWTHSGKGNAVVGARAGTGKTTTIKQAFTLAPEAKILYAVFNKKNQIEAESAIKDPRVQVKTLHSLGFAYLRYYLSKGLQPNDAVEEDRIDAVVGNGTAGAVKNAISRLVGFAKNTSITVPSVAELSDLADRKDLDVSQEHQEWPLGRLAGAARDVLELSLKPDKFGRISFNDMVWLPVAMNLVQPWFQLVVIDEAQDMNAPQLEMAIRACKKGGRICVVGDDRQAIYGFRGAVQDGMAMMRERLNAQTFGLTTTYRCPKGVVAIAAELVPDYKAAPSAPEGVVRSVTGAFTHQLQIGDAVLSRVNAPLMPLCLQLLRDGVPARIEGKDIGKQLLNLVRKMKARSVPEFIKKVEAWAVKQMERAAESRNRDEKIETIDDQAQMMVAVAEGAKSVADIERRITDLFQDSSENPRPAVVFSSTHKAKGLEWNRVFVLRSTYKVKGGPAPVSEESNLYYVAVTRAKQELVLVNSERDAA